MKKQDYIQLFNSIYPKWFDDKEIKALKSDEVFDEMIMLLSDFEQDKFPTDFDKSITFGYFHGDEHELLSAVAKVDSSWQRFFTSESKVYCAFVDGEIASFCYEEDFGEHIFGEKICKIAGPSCVGTIPKYRRRGIGLAMISNVTQNLKKNGYDISFIHYTGVKSWYEKLGYISVLQWNCNGIL